MSNKTLLVTGGCGFIGANFIRHLFTAADCPERVVNLDKLTYAGNPANLADIDRRFGGERYFFERVDIRDAEAVREVFSRYNVDAVCHFAAESHVDRSIHGPGEFIQTNINGTFNLLEAARGAWQGRKDVRFHHVSTDEVYGSLGDTGKFLETTPYDPRSPYSASKAASDHLVNAYWHTYGLPVTISNCSNNYGPYQFPEKLIPVLILNATAFKPLPIYGDGKNVRDWLFVEDHCAAIWKIVTAGRVGETYNVGGDREKTNLEVVAGVCDVLDELRPISSGQTIKSYKELITFVKDRPGHDRRYAIDCEKIKRELGWRQGHSWETGICDTVRWYLDNQAWVDGVRSGEYQKWMDTNYRSR